MPRDYLKIAQDAYSSSTSYVDSNYRKQWEDAINMFRSKHPAGSKYNTDAYRHRSKLFRPKTRSMVRKHEAAAAAAFFSNIDVVSTSAMDTGNLENVAAAELMQEVLGYRLTKTIPWFQLIVGAVQDAMTSGVVVSYQYWKHIAKKGPVEYVSVGVDESGTEVFDKAPERYEVKADEPCIELIPVENVRVDPGADWTDPIKSSPYVIRMIPMYAGDLRGLMGNDDQKTNMPKWKKLTDGQIRSAMTSSYDSTRQTREGNRQDSKSNENAPMKEFETVWVHENFVRVDGEEVVYFTLGTEFLLTDPKPLKEVYFHGERPIVLGTAAIEAHKAMPDSPVIMGEQLQREANEIVNQRMDNVKLVLNKRWIAKRGAQVDLKSLVRNVPGSITMASDVMGDVRAVEFGDVTSSSYQEQDRLNVDYDELTGNFSQGSIMTNRKMGETVGGMNMISNSANQITEYTIRTLTETWVEKVLRQLVKLEQAYETDEVILALAADRAKLFQKYGINQVTDELLNKELTLTVNVGMGATDPQQKLGKFIAAMKSYAEIAQMNLPGVDMAEIGKEIFGLAGYRDGRRFLGNDDKEAVVKEIMGQADQMIQQAQQALAQKEKEVSDQAASLDLEAARLDADDKALDLKEQLAIAKIQWATQKAVSDLSKVTEGLRATINETVSKMQSVELAGQVEVDEMVNLFRAVVNGQSQIAAIIEGIA